MAEPPDEGRMDPPPDGDRSAHDALFQLPVKYRVPLTLSALEGYTMREIAGMLHLPEGTVKARVFRAKQQLKTILKEANGDAE